MIDSCSSRAFIKQRWHRWHQHLVSMEFVRTLEMSSELLVYKDWEALVAQSKQSSPTTSRNIRPVAFKQRGCYFPIVALRDDC